MKFDLSKINLNDLWRGLGRRTLNFLGSSPRKYWAWFLFLVAIVLVSTIIFNVFLFLSFGATSFSETAVSRDTSRSKINLSGLESSVEALQNRRSAFNEAFVESLFGDPSL